MSPAGVLLILGKGLRTGDYEHTMNSRRAGEFTIAFHRQLWLITIEKVCDH